MADFKQEELAELPMVGPKRARNLMQQVRSIHGTMFSKFPGSTAG